MGSIPMRIFRQNLPIALILVLALMYLPAYAANNNVLEVQCFDKDGKPIANAKVEIMNVVANPAKGKDKKSDAKGVARFDKLDDGLYRAWSRVQGCVPAVYEYSALKDGASETIKLVFEPGADKKLGFEDKEIANQAAQALTAAVEDLRNNKFADAENKIKTSIAMDSSNAQAYMNLGIAQAQQKKWAEAEANLKLCSRIAGAIAKFQPNPFAQIAQQSDQILQKVPALRLRSEGSENLQKKNFKQAAALFQESLKYISDDPDTYYNLALAQANDKDFDAAIQSVDKAISMKAGETAYQDLKKQITGLKENDALARAQTVINEGEELFKKGDHAGAVVKYQEAMKVNLPPKALATILNLLARTEAAQKHPDQAIAAYKKAMELVPDNPAYKNALGQFYMTEKRFDEALSLFAEGGDGSSGDKALVTLGQQLGQKGNTEVAQLAFERAIKANPANAEAYYELGTLLYYKKVGDKTLKEDNVRARELFSKYIEIGKDNGHLDNAKNFMVIIDRRLKQQ
jgi:tetratricopeptide (TPR) repeat protein